MEDEPALVRGLTDTFRSHGFEVLTAIVSSLWHVREEASDGVIGLVELGRTPFPLFFFSALPLTN